MGWQASVWAPTVWAVGVWVCDTSAPRPYPGPAGAPAKRRGKQKRKPWIIGDQRIVATREEVEQILAEMLQQSAAPEPTPTAAPKPQPKVAPKDTAIVAAFPAYPDIRDMLLAAQQIEAAQALRAVALRLADEEDERDVELLLLNS